MKIKYAIKSHNVKYIHELLGQPFIHWTVPLFRLMTAVAKSTWPVDLTTLSFVFSSDVQAIDVLEVYMTSPPPPPPHPSPPHTPFFHFYSPVGIWHLKESVWREKEREEGLQDVPTPPLGDGQTRKHGKVHLKANGNWDGNRCTSRFPAGLEEHMRGAPLRWKCKAGTALWVVSIIIKNYIRII